ncbi:MULTISPECIES: hypothetical protein [Kitasatospora]|uniref:Uncharacterized protein n=1 Tax=Kitasatospora setae (strain ATCC 33774 / DSM 43861 / JCM 3304 / KCC A-0304 / NBRC 14216 / KM-6054) TaxID=452652 RepID=E4N799_KITSK|nr:MULTISPECIES: hypothetical protein [Kitasatospora]BAJ27080.1 hypothetical protein KSE_12470 [Kitasatospora setae KM-6054]
MLVRMLRALREDWYAVWVLLDDDARRKLAALLAGPGDDPVRTARTVQRLLKRALPAGHPLWDPADATDSARYADGGEDSPEALRAALAALGGSLADLAPVLPPSDQGKVFAVQHGEQLFYAPSAAGLAPPQGFDDRLLRASWTEIECRIAGADPFGPDLIRLIDHQGRLLLPSFQFDRATGEPLATVLDVNRLLDADDDPWGVADWWLGRNAWLAGVPAELLGTGRESELLRAARAELADW